MASWGRLARSAAQAAGRSLLRPAGATLASGEAQAARSLLPSSSPAGLQQLRGMAGGGHHAGEGVTYAGLTVHKPASWHVIVGKGSCAVMWFWIFYRFYHDYDTFLFGHAQHFEHEAHASHGSSGHGSKSDSKHH